MYMVILCKHCLDHYSGHGTSATIFPKSEDSQSLEAALQCSLQDVPSHNAPEPDEDPAMLAAIQASVKHEPSSPHHVTKSPNTRHNDAYLKRVLELSLQESLITNSVSVNPVIAGVSKSGDDDLKAVLELSLQNTSTGSKHSPGHPKDPSIPGTAEEASDEDTDLKKALEESLRVTQSEQWNLNSESGDSNHSESFMGPTGLDSPEKEDSQLKEAPELSMRTASSSMEASDSVNVSATHTVKAETDLDTTHSVGSASVLEVDPDDGDLPDVSSAGKREAVGVVVDTEPSSHSDTAVISDDETNSQDNLDVPSSHSDTAVISGDETNSQVNLDVVEAIKRSLQKQDSFQTTHGVHTPGTGTNDIVFPIREKSSRKIAKVSPTLSQSSSSEPGTISNPLSQLESLATLDDEEINEEYIQKQKDMMESLTKDNKRCASNSRSMSKIISLARIRPRSCVKSLDNTFSVVDDIPELVKDEPVSHDNQYGISPRIVSEQRKLLEKTSTPSKSKIDSGGLSRIRPGSCVKAPENHSFTLESATSASLDAPVLDDIYLGISPDVVAEQEKLLADVKSRTAAATIHLTGKGYSINNNVCMVNVTSIFVGLFEEK